MTSGASLCPSQGCEDGRIHGLDKNCPRCHGFGALCPICLGPLLKMESGAVVCRSDVNHFLRPAKKAS